MQTNVSNKFLNAKRNMIVGFITKLITMICPFIIKTVIIWKLGMEYVGLSSLFTSVLQVLSLAELGFGTAIIFSMYKPIAEKNTQKINALLNFYRRIYYFIGSIIFIASILMMPFIKFMISGSAPEDINIYVLYMIFCINTLSSYFFYGYSESILLAHQRVDIDNGIIAVFNLFMSILQILALILFGNYYIYVILIPLFTIIINIYRHKRIKKMYPYYLCKGKISSVEKKDLYKRVYGLMLSRICQATRNSFDSIAISSFLGLIILGKYQSYFLVMNTIIGFVSIITTSLVAGIGNDVATRSVEYNFNQFKSFVFFYNWISSWCTICLLCLYQPFMQLWLGKENQLPMLLVILMCIYFYSLKVGDNIALYKDATGLHWHDRYRPILESLSNLVLNFLLVFLFGVYGVVVSTIISIVFINIPWSAYVVFKNYFKKDIFKYFKEIIFNFFILCFVSFCTYLLCSLFSFKTVLITLIFRFLVCICVPNILYFLIFHKDARLKKMIKYIYIQAH